jgi:hypothetical protein
MERTGLFRGWFWCTILVDDHYLSKWNGSEGNRALAWTWISEELEPVTFEFEWQRRVASPAWSEDEYVCPKKLANRLISMLLGSDEPDQADADRLYVFSPEGDRVAVRRKYLVPN